MNTRQDHFGGVIPPVVVPLTSDGELDVTSYHRSINRMIDAGVDGLFFLGSSGEVVFSTDSRRDDILREGLAAVAGRVPTFAGVIDTETARVIEHAQRAKAMGVDALVATAPFYALGGMKETRRHFELIRSAVDLPLYAYDIPVCVHQKLDWRMLVELGKDGVLSGVKDSSGDDISFRFLVRENKRAGSPLCLLTGHEVVVDAALLGGADGAVPGLANVDPDAYVRMYKAARAGDWSSVVAEQDRLADLMLITAAVGSTVGFGAGVGAFKAALAILGVFDSPTMPIPVEPLSSQDMAGIEAVLRKTQLL